MSRLKVKNSRSVFLVFVLLLVGCSGSVLSFSGLHDSMSVFSNGEIVDPPFSGRGVNYNTVRMFDVSDVILHRDFSRFQRDGINVISLSLYWYRLEGNTRGDYDGVYADGTPYGSSFLEHVKRFIRVARIYELKVMVTFHTGWGDDSSWCIPDYVVDPETGKNVGHAIVKSEGMKQAFLDMVNHTVRYLKDEDIWSWAILNEPWGIEWRESFIDLIQRESFLVKSIDDRPVTVRFVSSQQPWTDANGTPHTRNHFAYVWNWDQRIFDALDFISFNPYILPELYDDWFNITKENVVGCFERGKRVWITEFGCNSDDDVIQAENYAKTLQVLQSLPIDGWLAWVWNQLYPSVPGIGWNMLEDVEGNPRPAYYELLQYDPKV